MRKWLAEGTGPKATPERHLFVWACDVWLAEGTGPQRPDPSATHMSCHGTGPKGPDPSRPGQKCKGIAPWEGAFKATPEPAQQRVACAEDGATQATPEPPPFTQHGLANGSGS